MVYALSVVFMFHHLSLSLSLQTLLLVGGIPFAAEILSIFSDEVRLVYTANQLHLQHNYPPPHTHTHTLSHFRHKPFWVLTRCCPSKCSAFWSHLPVSCSCSSGVWLTITSKQPIYTYLHGIPTVCPELLLSLLFILGIPKMLLKKTT